MECHSRDQQVSAEQLLWHILGLMVQHDGQLKPGLVPEKGVKGRTNAPATGEFLLSNILRCAARIFDDTHTFRPSFHSLDHTN